MTRMCDILFSFLLQSMAISRGPSELIDDRVSLNQCTKAVTALLKHARLQQEKEEATQLLPGKEQHVWLITTVKRMQPHMSLKPQRMYVIVYLEDVFPVITSS